VACCTLKRRHFTSFDIKTEIVKRAARWGHRRHYSSPIAAGGRIYTISEEGKLSVIQPGAQWELLSVIDFKEGAKATPAIAGGRIYLRTDAALYCFAKPN
jgi:hypothetical protein